MSKNKRPAQVTWAQAARDITVAAINKGQLLPLGVIAIILLIIWKLPENEVLAFGRDFLDMLRKGEMISYPICGILAFGWFFHSRSMRKRFSDEFKRIGTEKSDLQIKAAGVNFESSD